MLQAVAKGWTQGDRAPGIPRFRTAAGPALVPARVGDRSNLGDHVAPSDCADQDDRQRRTAEPGMPREADDIREVLEYAAASTDVHGRSFQTPA